MRCDAGFGEEYAPVVCFISPVLQIRPIQLFAQYFLIMKHLIWLLWFFASVQCRQNSSSSTSMLLTSGEFEKMLHNKSDIQLLDVRTPQEYASGFIAGARNIDIYDAGFEAQIAKLDKSRPVMVYCAKGGRSASAAEQLKRAGFPEVYDLVGGMEAWKEAGKPVSQ